jgi:hypothetical protein
LSRTFSRLFKDFSKPLHGPSDTGKKDTPPQLQEKRRPERNPAIFDILPPDSEYLSSF